MTDKEKAATDWANERCPGQDATDIVWCMCREDFLGGYERGKLDGIMAEMRWWAKNYDLLKNHVDLLKNHAGFSFFIPLEKRDEIRTLVKDMDARVKEVLG